MILVWKANALKNSKNPENSGKSENGPLGRRLRPCPSLTQASMRRSKSLGELRPVKRPDPSQIPPPPPLPSKWKDEEVRKKKIES